MGRGKHSADKDEYYLNLNFYHHFPKLIMTQYSQGN